MASGHPLIWRSRAFAAKVETTAGTAVSLSATDAAIVNYDPRLDYDISMNKRPSPGSMSQLAGVAGAQKANVSVRTEIVGSATNPLWATTLLAAAGFSVSSRVWSPVSGSASADT